MSFELANVSILREAYIIWKYMTRLGLESKRMTQYNGKYASIMLSVLVDALKEMDQSKMSDLERYAFTMAIKDTEEYLKTDASGRREERLSKQDLI